MTFDLFFADRKPCSRQVKLCVVLIFTCGVPLHSRRQTSGKAVKQGEIHGRLQILPDKQPEFQTNSPSLPEELIGQSLVERTHSIVGVDSGEPLTISAIVGIVFAIISIVTTIWDLWEKWNAIIMLKYAMSEMKNSDWATLQKYEQYSEISFCVRDRINEAVDTMNVVATYFKMLHYAETQCSRPDVHLDWLTTSKRCTRDFAVERVEEMYSEICSAQYGEGLFSTVEMLLDDSSVMPSMDGCQCLEDHLCDGKTWCHVAEDSTCPDKSWSFGSGYYSNMPCKIKGMVDKDKARSLLKSTCTVCNHGFFRNAGLIENDFYAGILDPSLTGKDIKDERIRQAVKLRYSNVTGQMTPDMTVIEDETHITIEEKVYLEVIKWERLMEFDGKCNDFKNTLSINERTQMTGEDLINEKINRLSVDGRLGKLGTDMEWQAEKVGNLFAKKGADAFADAQGNNASLLELDGLQEVRNSVHRLQARRKTNNSANAPNLDKCSDFKILNQDTDGLKEMAVGSSEIMAASECVVIEGATKRNSAWRRWGVACKCEAYSTKVYCDQDVIADRKFELAAVVAKQCKTKLYCSKFPKTEQQVKFLVKSRLGCSTIAGAEDKTLNSAPHCKCQNPSHMLFCGADNYGRGSIFHLYDDVFNNRQCFENARCAAPEDASSLEAVNAAYATSEACIEVFGAKPRESIFAGNLQSADCKCDYNQEVYCGQEKIQGEEFQKKKILQEGCASLLYCAEQAWPDEKVLDMMKTSAKPVAETVRASDLQLSEEKVTVDRASLIQLRSSNEGLTDVLLWVPMQLARVLKVTTQGIVDWGQAIWWFAFNNIYGAMGTMEAFGLLAKAAQLWDKFVQWTGIVTFFIWLINDAIFVGMNSALCPKIADWIEIMDGVRAGSGAEGNRGNETAVASDQNVFGSKGIRVSESTSANRKWCDTQLEDVNAEMQRELVERTVILRRLVEFNREAASEMPAGLSDPTEVLESLKTDPDELQEQVKKLSWTEGDEKVGLELVQIHARVTTLLKERLSLEAICPVSDRVMEFNWTDSPHLKSIHERNIHHSACRCDPRPLECGELDDGGGTPAPVVPANVSLSINGTTVTTTTITTVTGTTTTILHKHLLQNSKTAFVAWSGIVLAVAVTFITLLSVVAFVRMRQ